MKGLKGMNAWIKIRFFAITIFIAGIVTAMNLSVLIPADPSFEGSWSMIGFACLCAIWFTVKILECFNELALRKRLNDKSMRRAASQMIRREERIPK